MGCVFWTLDADGEAAGSICSKSIQIFTSRSFLTREHSRSLKNTYFWPQLSKFRNTSEMKREKVEMKNEFGQLQAMSMLLTFSTRMGRSDHPSSKISTYFKQVEFDRIVTNEMFEHMKNYDRLFEKVSKWLKPETGLLFIHVFCHRNYPYQFKVKSSNNADWMAKNYFTGGSMPSYGQFDRVVLVDFNDFLDTFLFFQRNLRIQNTWVMNGTHYSKVIISRFS